MLNHFNQDYSQYSEAYTIPGDVKTKGADFLAEAERYMGAHFFETGSGTRLADLQGILLLYERFEYTESTSQTGLDS